MCHYIQCSCSSRCSSLTVSYASCTVYCIGVVVDVVVGVSVDVVCIIGGTVLAVVEGVCVCAVVGDVSLFHMGFVQCWCRCSSF